MLVVADGRGDDVCDGVIIFDVGYFVGRLNRMFQTTRHVFHKAVELDADIYHLHDPELLPTGLKLKRLGKKVIFDSHEDVPKQLLGKPYLYPWLLRILSWGFTHFERYACMRLDAIVVATPWIKGKFLKINPCTIDINNFPMLEELASADDEREERTKVCYVGGIEAIRGAREIVRALESVQSGARLELAGKFSDPTLRAEVQQYKGWSRIDERGFVDRIGVRDLLGRSFAGLVTFLPVPNHIDAQPNKMFEYMSAGVPVIASNFPLWREIVEENACGICIDPSQPHEIAAAIDFLAKNPNQVKIMGENGRRAVLDRYNWAKEEKKLLNLYMSLSSL
jgi:glycosyltransferase involved in cell wall biosynthesis